MAATTGPDPPPLPTPATTLALPFPFRQWVGIAAKRATLWLASVPLLTIALIAAMAAANQNVACSNDESCVYALAGAFVFLAALISLVGLLALSTLLARVGADKRRAPATRRLDERLEVLKEHYLRGELEETDYERIRGLLDLGATRGASLDVAEAVRAIRIYGILLGVAGGLLLPPTLLMASDAVYAPELVPLLVGLLAVDAVVSALLVTAWRTVAKAGRIATTAHEALLRRVDALELEAMRATHQGRRRTHAGSGPSFNLYGR